MDDIDQAILRMLRENARTSLKAISGKVDLARSSVRERIAKLERAGTIRGYRADIAPDGQPGLRAILLMRLRITPSPGIVRRVTATKAVRRCYSLSGEIDLLVEIEAPTMARLNATRDALAQIDGVADVTTAPILNVDKE
jgi:DNA-binding Lrp family transcriptional regulator